jgi:hypothetical protein
LLWALVKDHVVIKPPKRTPKIHGASRMQALNKNKQDTTLGAFRKRGLAFFARLFGRQPASRQAKAIQAAAAPSQPQC